MRFGVVVFPGTNCDQDCYHVVKDVLGKDADYIWHQDTDISGCDCIILPGGFSYGDYLRTGAVAKFSPVMSSIIDFANKGGLVLGICNGFQVLLESGLLPGAMLRNRSLKFRCIPTCLRVENAGTPFTNLCREGEVLSIPIAHNEGNYYIDNEGLNELKANGQIIFRYSDPAGNVSPDTNPNGSVENIAGICNKKGNVLGMMPHPERASEAILGSTDGRKIFDSVIKYFEERGL